MEVKKRPMSHTTEFFISIKDFVWGILKAWIWISVTILAGALDLISIYTGSNPIIPQSVLRYVVSVGVFLAAVTAHHQLRMQKGALEEKALRVESKRLEIVFNVCSNPSH